MTKSRIHSALFQAALLPTAFLYAPALHAQQLSQAEIDAMIGKQRRQVAVDADGCLKYPQDEDPDVIVVCGEERSDQRVFDNEYDPEAIHRGEVVTTRGSQCIGDFLQCGHRLHPVAGSPFGYVKPMAVDWDETMGGLPEPEMVVTAEMIAAEEAASREAQQAKAPE